MKVSASAVALILCVFASTSFAKVDPQAAPQHYNYRGAGQQMKRIYYGDLQETIYSGCKYNDKKKVDYSTCNFRPRENPRRKSFKRVNP